jgi:hypothetical protein
MNEIDNESGNQGSNLVSVEHDKVSSLVNEVVHQSVRIAVQTARSLPVAEDADQRGRKSLLCLDKVGATLVIQSLCICVRGVVQL